MISDETYEKMVLMSYGRVPRDQAWLDEQARLGHIQEGVEARAKYAKEHQSPRSQREIELEQREFDLKMFGKTAMQKFARSLEPENKLLLPGELLQGHSADQGRPIPPKHLKLQHHGAEPGCKMWKV